MKREKLFLLNATQFDERVTLNVYSNILSAAFILIGVQQSTIRINDKPSKKVKRDTVS